MNEKTGYGDDHLICVGCYNKIENFIEQSVKKGGAE